MATSRRRVILSGLLLLVLLTFGLPGTAFAQLKAEHRWSSAREVPPLPLDSALSIGRGAYVGAFFGTGIGLMSSVLTEADGAAAAMAGGLTGTAGGMWVAHQRRSRSLTAREGFLYGALPGIALGALVGGLNWGPAGSLVWGGIMGLPGGVAGAVVAGGYSG